MLFWIAATIILIIVLVWLLWPVFKRTDDAKAHHQSETAFYKSQLANIERDFERGVLSDLDAKNLRSEVARNLIAADQREKEGGVTSSLSNGAKYAISGGVMVVLVAALFGLYPSMGAQGYPDMPLKERIAQAKELRKNRPSQTEFESRLPVFSDAGVNARHLELVKQLRLALEARKEDLEGHRLLASNEAAMGNYQAAHKAQIKVIEILGPKATDTDYAILADLMIQAGRGYVSPEAETALTRSLQVNPDNQMARYYSGLMFAQNMRPDLAFRIWRPLYEASSADAPWVPPLVDQLPHVARLAGVKYKLPEKTALAGPSQEDVENAADMAPEDRQEMIKSMVSQLSDRLATQGGSAQEWARLISAHGVLGNIEQAAAIWTEARLVFKGKPEMLKLIDAAATKAGLGEK
ncbi:MAG: c-type cytochrome biogenesis protein CcmI [Halocynthiibacter sp.]